MTKRFINIVLILKCMADYNKFYETVGTLSKLAGLGAVIYGIATQDMETIAGGVAMAYVGKTMVDPLMDFQRNVIQERRNAILKSKPTLDDKID
jgi:hypothetical protein